MKTETAAVVVAAVDPVGNSEHSGELSTSPQAKPGSAVALVLFKALAKTEGLTDKFKDVGAVS